MRASRYTQTKVSKPLLVWDGDCRFCGLWVERWREATGEAVQYRPFQKAAAEFPEVPLSEFEQAVQFIEPDGRVSSGAAAAFQALSLAPGRRWLLSFYERVPAFAWAMDLGYASIARHRTAASVLTRALWGGDVRRPTYFAARRWFLRALGAIFFVAFISLWAQVDGLIGSRGILPVGEFLGAVREQLGGRGYFAFPTLCWLGSSDGALHFLCGSGALVSLALIAGLAPPLSLALSVLLYLSLTIAGQTFFNFQWDILLLETGFLAIFLAPLQLWPRCHHEPPLSRVALFLLQCLFFKLMFMSGAVKLTSGDESWWNLTALHYHYETQPLPTVIAWWAHQSADWFQRLSVAFLLFVEIIAPFFLWAPRRLRLAAVSLQVTLQVLIALTGNYCFFNFLTVALCLLFIDDSVWPGKRAREKSPSPSRFWTKTTPCVVLLVTLPINAMLLLASLKPMVTWPSPLAFVRDEIEPFRVVNGYGLFRVMTTTRREIEIEGSNDGEVWLPYRFKWKPGDPGDPPSLVAPHQPRLDWQMWFAALGTYQQNPWFVQLLVRLLQGDTEVLCLLGPNPFPQAPPRYMRATLFEYRFTTTEERRRTGAWWKRTAQGAYCPVVSLK